jgi:hypothetical protein
MTETVWIVHHSNYFPRELDSIWKTKEDAEYYMKQQENINAQDLNCEEWAVKVIIPKKIGDNSD